MKCARLSVAWACICLIIMTLPVHGDRDEFFAATEAAFAVAQAPTGTILPPPGPGEEVLFAKVNLAGISGNVLVRVDHKTTPGLSEPIGPIGFGQIYSMDFDPDGIFFAVGTKPGAPGRYLIEIDPETGAGTSIGGPLVGVSSSFASDPDGNLYGSVGASNALLYAIDRITGLSTLVGALYYQTTHQGMDFNPDGDLYLLTRDILPGSDNMPALLKVDTLTGRASLVAEFKAEFVPGVVESLRGRTSSYDMSFAKDGTLYASCVIDGRPWLLTVDTVTGIGTPLGIMRIPDGAGGWIYVETSSLAFGPPQWANLPPVAVINAPEEVEAISWDENPVTLDGSHSYDPDSEAPLYHVWRDADDNWLGSGEVLTVDLPLGSNEITLLVWDSENKMGSAIASVEVVDTTPPVIDCLDVMWVEGDRTGGAAPTHPRIRLVLDYPSAEDVLDPDPQITHDAPEDLFPLGETVVTFTATDMFGNASTDQSRVIVEDTTPPDVNCEEEITLEADGPDGVSASDSAVEEYLTSATATDIVDPEPVITNDAPSDHFPLGETTVTFTATDASGNSATRQGTVRVVDTTPPTIEGPESIILESPGPGGMPAESEDIQTFLSATTAIDIVDPAPVLTNDAPPDLFPMGETVVVFTATDAAGNTASRPVTVAVTDTLPPQITCPDDIAVEALGPDGAPVSLAEVAAFLDGAGAADLVDLEPVITHDAPSDFFPLGVTVVTFTAADESGNAASCEASLTVIDTTPPDITCPDDMVVEAEGPDGVPAGNAQIEAFLSGATVTDAVDPSAAVEHDAPNDTFPLGPTVVSFTATDESGNTAGCQATVEVVDTTPPTIAPVDDITREAQGPGGVPVSDPAIQAFLASVAAVDTVDPSPSVTHDAPSDFFPQGSTEVTFTATDVSGNSAVSRASVVVVDTTPPDIGCPDDTTVEAAGAAGIPASDPAIQAFLAGASATDVVDPSPTITNDAPTDFFPLGPTVVTFTATDESGNAAGCQATVTVIDSTPPTLNCPESITVEAQSPQGVPADDPAIQAFLAGATMSDAVDPSPVITNDAPSDFFPLGDTVVTFTAVDEWGNEATCQATVSVVDTTPPVLVCPDDLTMEALDINGVPASDPAIQAFFDGASATDLCDPSPTITVDAPTGYFPIGTTTVTFTATDASGNSVSDSRIVTVSTPVNRFVTGGGWIDSPSGAYPADPTLADKANFGFTARKDEETGETTGQLEFHLNEAPLRIHNVCYEQLTIVGAVARASGDCRIKGSGLCKFAFTAIDGDFEGDAYGEDAFRIRLFNARTDEVIYDNQPGAPPDSDAATLLSGSIVIHEQEEQ